MGDNNDTGLTVWVNNDTGLTVLVVTIILG